MIALYPHPDLAAALAVPGGLKPDDLHVTVAYLGEAADVDRQAVIAVGRELAARSPIRATISGHARFTGGPDGDVIVALVDGPDLEVLRRDTVDALAAAGLPLPREHGFTAHTTLLYLPPDEPSPIARINPATTAYGALCVVYGDDRTDIPFEPNLARIHVHEQARRARRAYAVGWAASGGPMTGRVERGCEAAVEHALANPGDSQILEVTLHLGHLEGVWARIYQRRKQQIDDHSAKAQTAWRHLLTRDMLVRIVGDFRRGIGTAESAPAEIELVEDAQDDQRRAAIQSAAAATAQAFINLLRGRPELRDLRQVLRDALAAGRAEGEIDAVALVADRLERVGLKWDLAFDHAYAALANLDALSAGADGWLGRMLDRAAADLGRALAADAEAGVTYARMLTDAMAALDSADVQAVSFVVDWAMTAAQGAGALNLYRSEGLAALDWLTAGDGRVCPSCQANEDNNPYAPDQFPVLPDHPRCRCAPAPSGDVTALALSAYSNFFTGEGGDG